MFVALTFSVVFGGRNATRLSGPPDGGRHFFLFFVEVRTLSRFSTTA
jgi:hypothetical protein